MDQEKKQHGALVPVQSTALTASAKPSYWARVGDAYSALFRGFLVALPIFVVVFMITCPHAFHSDSVFGFTKDLEAAASFASEDYQPVSFTYASGECEVLAYRGGLAAVNKNGIEIYAPNGERTLDVPLTLATPRAVASRKYLLAYDFGATSFAVTNAYSRLFWADTDFPIYYAQMGESGRFALVTASDKHLSQVLLYDAKFNLIQRFSRASATTAVTISDNGRYAAICGILSEGGETFSVVDLYRIGAEKPSFSLRFEGELAMGLSFVDNRRLAFVSDKALRVLDLDGDVENECSFEGEALAGFSCDKNGCLVLLEQDALATTERLLILDKKGALSGEIRLTGGVRAMARSKEMVFLLFDDHVSRVAAVDPIEERLPCDPMAVGIHAIDEARVRVTYSAQAIYLNFNKT